MKRKTKQKKKTREEALKEGRTGVYARTSVSVMHRVKQRREEFKEIKKDY